MRFILNVEPENLIIGCRAAAWLHARSEKNAVLAYGDKPNEVVMMFVRRNKSSISVFQEPKR